MKRFKNPLLVVSEEEDFRVALETAAGLTKKNRGRLSILEVLDPMHGLVDKLDRYEAIQKAVVTDRIEAIRKLAMPHVENDFDIRITVTVGSRNIEAARRVIQEKHDLVVCNSRGHQSHHDAIQLMRTCPCPVWGVKSAAPNPYERILACVDPDPNHPKHHQLNQIIIELALSQAELEDAELHILHCYDVFEDSVLMGSGKLTAYEAREHAEAIEEAHQVAVKRLLADYDFSRVERRVHVLKGRSGHVIPKWAADHAVDLVVMGTLGRTGLAAFFIGNTAEAVLRQVDCSVLAVKPPDFETPVNFLPEDVLSLSEWVKGSQTSS